MSLRPGERRPPTEAEKAATAEEASRVDRLYASVFGTPDGLKVLALLRERYDERPLGAEASHSALAYREGQRQVLRDIETRTANGRDQHPTALRREYPALG
ncbi:hypothetical protein ACIU1J_27625 [Azospirillum doebereinerae]|uniref:Bbp19 family protein n=1 Tax=Azospirillum doebereinerae TaxID=92933 RepID=UPI001EE59FB9|nr:hypothetical protein [Azospirillum doebereinerae]MCG5241391.1 hypothetical protein [Azospirillum doebereinerae]